MNTRKSSFVKVEGQDVFTATFVFEQMQAQGCRIDRAKAISVISMAIAVLSLAACVYLMLLVR